MVIGEPLRFPIRTEVTSCNASRVFWPIITVGLRCQDCQFLKITCECDHCHCRTTSGKLLDPRARAIEAEIVQMEQL